ncbi:sigma-70 family RNA polymerase sigma factor [candidate division WOR-3 bacterium]|uniref:Sigma-70 family RNA polymerase sigma factor n=1 Tax=candidate division WOR-3 bacterium TaxID=2052148 RepID=A0A9D5QCG5_UNCW3|nr:sigma-70 family RNA polymerase sigma factor [candidate division WOR-3 bacterium]MBD3364017.1 sigma-70 family RNA polymerase sigma factor [candidate division WOR-3 bacterium]
MLDPDSELIRKVSDGDGKSFTELVDKYKNRVFSTVYRYVKDPSMTEDLAQEIFIKVWKNARTFKGKSAFSTWLYRIVVNHCLSFHSRRKRHRTVELDESIPDSGGSLEERMDKRAKSELIRQTVGALNRRQRIALILFKFEGYSCKEVAEIMGISFSAAQSLIFRAIDNLRKKLTPLRESRKI